MSDYKNHLGDNMSTPIGLGPAVKRASILPERITPRDRMRQYDQAKYLIGHMAEMEASLAMARVEYLQVGWRIERIEKILEKVKEFWDEEDNNVR